MSTDLVTVTTDTLVEDANAAGFKVIDLLDMDELENGMYDVPSQQRGWTVRRITRVAYLAAPWEAGP